MLKSGIASPSLMMLPFSSVPMICVGDLPSSIRVCPYAKPNPATVNGGTSSGRSVISPTFLANVVRDTQVRAEVCTGVMPSCASMPRLRSSPPLITRWV